MKTSDSPTVWRSWIPVFLFGVILAGCSDSREEQMAELSHSSPVRRAGAVRVLAQDENKEAYLLATKALSDNSAIVRIAAVRALADFKEQDTTAALIRASRDADPEVRMVAVSKLALRPGDQVKKALLDLLLRSESNSQVRRAIFDALEKKGLSGDRLAEQLASGQMETIKESWADAAPAQRVRMIQEAGHSIHPDGIGFVLRGLSDQDASVVLTAMTLLDGRGGKRALKQLMRLASDHSPKIRMGAVRALRRYGADGSAVLQGALRDLHPEVRTLALAAILESGADLDPALLCPLIQYEDNEAAFRAARILGKRDIACSLEVIAQWLEDPDDSRYTNAVFVLAFLGGEQAQSLLRKEMNRRPASLKPLLAQALARAGCRDKKVADFINRELGKRIDEIETLTTGWVTGKLVPVVEPPKKAKDKTRLSDEEMKKLYEKHGLEPAGEGAPRGVSDLLASFKDPGSRGPAAKLFDPLFEEDIQGLVGLFQGLMAMEPESAKNHAKRLLMMTNPDLVALVAGVLVEKGERAELDETTIKKLMEVFLRVDEDKAAFIAKLVGSSEHPDAAKALAGALKESSWEKREIIIDELGKMNAKEVVTDLQEMLLGYSAASAAKVLGKLGEPSSIEPLREALNRVGPAAELDILMALARLGATDILPVLAERVSDSMPEVRLAAVRILGVLGPEHAKEYLLNARYDLDRLVRTEALEILNRMQGGEGNNGRRNP